jgi:hypothetical protein
VRPSYATTLCIATKSTQEAHSIQQMGSLVISTSLQAINKKGTMRNIRQKIIANWEIVLSWDPLASFTELPMLSPWGGAASAARAVQ